MATCVTCIHVEYDKNSNKADPPGLCYAIPPSPKGERPIMSIHSRACGIYTKAEMEEEPLSVEEEAVKNSMAQPEEIPDTAVPVDGAKMEESIPNGDGNPSNDKAGPFLEHSGDTVDSAENKLKID